MKTANISSTTHPQNEHDEIIIRRMRLSDAPIMAKIASTEYFDTDLNAFLCPHRHAFPADVTRRFQQTMQGRYFNTRCVSFVAVLASSVSVPVGYMQSIRVGDDQPAKKLIRAQTSLWHILSSWYYSWRTAIVKFLFPDRSVDVNALATFNEFCQVDEKKYWNSTEMKTQYENRWHVQSLVVSSDFQRRGIGRKLMNEITQRAEEEGVVVGLEASAEGEKLYTSLGFALRGRFSLTVGPEGVGGVMMWRPRKMQ